MKLLKKLARAALIVIDDFGVAVVAGKQYRDLLEILDDRHGLGSTLITSQFPVDQRHGVINDATVADAILDRLVQNAYRLDFKRESIRKTRAASTLTLNLLRINRSGRPSGVRPQTRPPPNGTQAHDISREL